MSYIKSGAIKFMCIYIDSYDRQEKIETFVYKADMEKFCRSDNVYSVVNIYSLTEI